MGSLPLWKGNNRWSLEHCSILCIVQFAAPFARKYDHQLPLPPDPYMSETAFSPAFEQIYTPPPALYKLQRTELLRSLRPL